MDDSDTIPEPTPVLEPYSEIGLAKSARSKDAKSKEPIDLGELRYTDQRPNGNHYEGKNFKLVTMGKIKLKRAVEGAGGIEMLRGISELPTDAREVACEIIRCILNGDPISDELASFRKVPEKKPRKRKAESSGALQIEPKLPKLVLPVPLGILRCSTTFGSDWAYRA